MFAAAYGRPVPVAEAQKLMGVMGEEQHLRRSREFRQHPETGLGTLIVEIDEQVVREEGQANTGRDGLLDSCEAKREKELVRGSLAHRPDVHHGPAVVA